MVSRMNKFNQECDYEYMKKRVMEFKINDSFLTDIGFSKAERYYSKKDQQFRVKYIHEGYDSDVIITPVPQTVGGTPPEIQVDQLSEINFLIDHHIGDYQIYVGNLQAHLTTLQDQDDLIELLRICKIL